MRESKIHVTKITAKRSAATKNLVQAALSDWPGYPILQDELRSASAGQFYLAGGAARDIFTGSRVRKDFDFFVDAGCAPDFLAHLRPYGEMAIGPFGSPRWHPRDDPMRYADIIPIQSFYNGLWRCEDMVDALNQFDFTANAIAVDLKDYAVLDPVNGLRDIRQRTMRAVRFDYPMEPISPICELSRLSVLWIRIKHYAKLLGVEIEPVTGKWLTEHAWFVRDKETFAKVFFPPNF